MRKTNLAGVAVQFSTFFNQYWWTMAPILAGVAVLLLGSNFATEKGTTPEDVLKAKAEACLSYFGREKLKDPQGAYIISYRPGDRNTSDIEVDYSALNGLGGRDRGTVRCQFRMDGTVDESASRVAWILDRMRAEKGER